MKYTNLLKLFVVFSMTLVGLKADIFDIEDDQDLCGVSNTFISFYCRNYDNLMKYKAEEFKLGNAFRVIVAELKKSYSPLYTAYLYDKKGFRLKFLHLKRYIKANQDQIKENLGEENFGIFVNGVYYTQQLLKNLR